LAVLGFGALGPGMDFLRPRGGGGGDPGLCGPSGPGRPWKTGVGKVGGGGAVVLDSRAAPPAGPPDGPAGGVEGRKKLAREGAGGGRV